MSENIVDCEAGRRLGCATFCCRLLVRLDENERPAGRGSTAKSCIDKDADGFCVHLDRANHRCRDWQNRPRVCREYECNSDYLLQVAIHKGVSNIVQLARDAATLRIPEQSHVRVPVCSIQGRAQREEPEQ